MKRARFITYLSTFCQVNWQLHSYTLVTQMSCKPQTQDKFTRISVQFRSDSQNQRFPDSQNSQSLSVTVWHSFQFGRNDSRGEGWEGERWDRWEGESGWDEWEREEKATRERRDFGRRSVAQSSKRRLATKNTNTNSGRTLADQTRASVGIATDLTLNRPCLRVVYSIPHPSHHREREFNVQLYILWRHVKLQTCECQHWSTTHCESVSVMST